MFPLSPVGFNFGIPPANKPPSGIGPPLLLLLIAALEVLVLLLLLNEGLFDSPLTLPAIAGALLSTVTVFFKVLPALMDCNNKFLLSATGGPEVVTCGGGGGGGTDILIILLNKAPFFLSPHRLLDNPVDTRTCSYVRDSSDSRQPLPYLRVRWLGFPANDTHNYLETKKKEERGPLSGDEWIPLSTIRAVTRRRRSWRHHGRGWGSRSRRE